MFKISHSTPNALTEICTEICDNKIIGPVGPVGPGIGTSLLSERFTTMTNSNPTLNTIVTYVIH